jgi:hypothetical protein
MGDGQNFTGQNFTGHNFTGQKFYKVRMKFILTLCHGIAYAYASSINFSLKIFSETITPSKMIFLQECALVCPLRFVHEVLKFRIFSEQNMKNMEKQKPVS